MIRPPPPRAFRDPTVLGALALALLCAWPMLTSPQISLQTGTAGPPPFVYTDSFAYEVLGRATTRLLMRALSLAGPEGGGGGGEDPAAAAPSFRGLRSAAWSLSLGLLGGLPWGGIALALAQTAATLFVLSALVPAGATGAALAGGALAVAALSGLPWYASYAMPDMLGALVLAYYAALAGPFAELGRRQRLLFGLLATYAILGHYGHLPLAGALAAGAIGLAALRRHPPGALAVAALGPPALAALVNLGTGIAAEALVERARGAAPPATAIPADAPDAAPDAADAPTVSLTPGRLPIVLARSIEDGPGRLHLREACARNLYRSCAFLPLEAETVHAFLWAPGGLQALDPRQRAILRAEEMTIVRDAARAYPLRQAAALARNVGLQLARVGVDQHYPLPGWNADGTRRPVVEARTLSTPALAAADRALPALTGLAAAALALAALLGRVPPVLWAPFAMLLAGIALNAAIYGGLSYPVDRYGGRVAWLVPAMLALALAVPSGRTRSGRAVR